MHAAESMSFPQMGSAWLSFPLARPLPQPGGLEFADDVWVGVRANSFRLQEYLSYHLKKAGIGPL